MQHGKKQEDLLKSLRSLQHDLERNEHWRMSSITISLAIDYIKHLESMLLANNLID